MTIDVVAEEARVDAAIDCLELSCSKSSIALADIQAKQVTAETIVNSITDQSVIETVINQHAGTEANLLNLIYVNGNALDDTGDGSDTNPYKSILTACMATLEGRHNLIYMHTGVDYRLGDASQTVQIRKIFKASTSILFFVWNSSAGVASKLILPFFDNTTVSLPAFSFGLSGTGRGNKLTVSGYHIGLETEKFAGLAPAAFNGLLSCSYGNDLSFFWKGSALDDNARDILIDEDTFIISPYIQARSVDISLAYVKLNGGGSLCDGRYYTISKCNFIGVTEEVGSTMRLYSHLRADRSNILCSDGSASFLTKIEG